MVTAGYMRGIVNALLTARNVLWEKAHGTSGNHDPDPYDILDAALYKKKEWKRWFGKVGLYYFHCVVSKTIEKFIKKRWMK